MLVFLPLLVLIAQTPPERPAASAVLPGSGLFLDALPGEYRWEAEATVTLTDTKEYAVDRLMAWVGDERRITIEVKKTKCPERSPATTPAWPTLGFQSMREALPEQLAVTTCKAPDQELTLRFPAGTSKVVELLLEEADRWEPVVAMIHKSISSGTIDLPRALAGRDHILFRRADDAAEDLVEQLSLPLSIRVGTSSKTRGVLSVDRGSDRQPWVVRALGPHDVLVLVAPISARVMLQLIPFDPKFDCEVALGHALKGQPAATNARPGTADPASAAAFMPRTPPGWEVSRAVGDTSAAFCVRSDKLGLVALGGGRVPREVWLPVAMPPLSRIGDAILKH